MTIGANCRGGCCIDAPSYRGRLSLPFGSILRFLPRRAFKITDLILNRGPVYTIETQCGYTSATVEHQADSTRFLLSVRLARPLLLMSQRMNRLSPVLPSRPIS
jgi:hypothetical protein